MNEYIMNTYYMDISLILHALKNTSSKKKDKSFNEKRYLEKNTHCRQLFCWCDKRIEL